MFIKQISVFLENKPGTLRELTNVLGDGRIDIRELSVADTQSFGIVRMLVRSDRMDAAMTLLRKSGYTARLNSVICAEIEDKPNALSGLLGIIEDEGLSVEYIYSCRRTPEGNALMVLRLSEMDRGQEVLIRHGITLHTQEEIDKY